MNNFETLVLQRNLLCLTVKVWELSLNKLAH